ncbi:MAG: glycerophosphodiester phosphodiesterase [Ruminococcus sp.]|nr:glycerophosphodiester phosphodiesterase [Ruminococcus sp.]MCM1155583.1 glycerophosphodiester phosphodiesterase [Roseburia sp.]
MLQKAGTTAATGSIFLALLYLFLIMPRILKRPKKTPYLGVFYAHRGLHDNHTEAPENSMKAFKKAVEAGYGIELDVQLTRDGIPVIFHDFTLERVCGASGKLREYTYGQLQELFLLNTQEKIPTLEEFLKMVDGRVPLIVELKVEWADLALCPAVDKLLSSYQGTYCIESFNPLVLLWYRRHRREVMRGQLSTNFRRDGNYKSVLHFLLTHLLLNWVALPDFIAYNCQFKGEPGRRICRKLYKNLAVAWTVQNQKQLESLEKDFDLFIFDSFIPEDTKISVKNKEKIGA